MSGENFTGLLNTSGTQVQAWATDLLTTTRQAITKLETRNLAASGWILHPADWERIELTVNASGYALGAGAAVPVDRAARRLWGVPVALSTSAVVGTGWVADFAGSTELKLREEAVIDWSENLYSPDQFGAGQGGSLSHANQIVFRCELRAGLDVTRPIGLVKTTLNAP